MSEDKPTASEGLSAVGTMLQSCGCLIMLAFVLVGLGIFIWAAACS